MSVLKLFLSLEHKTAFTYKSLVLKLLRFFFQIHVIKWYSECCHKKKSSIKYMVHGFLFWLL